jgi:hypothetical protein
MQSKKLDTHQIIPRSNASWQSEVVPASICYHGINCPFAVRKSVMRDFEPLQASRASGSSIVYLGQPV